MFNLEHVGLRVGEGPGATEILRDVSLSLGGEGIIVIVGPSGSGKSTLLRLLNRLESPTSGSISYQGRSLASWDPRNLRRRVGMVFQKPTVFEGSGMDNMLVADPSVSREQASRLLARVGLDTALLDREANRLSGGEAQRLCLARTLAAGPDIVLMDEPTSALDTEAVHTIETLARTLADEGIGQIWVSHDPEQVKRLADRVITLEGGRITDPGTSR